MHRPAPDQARGDDERTYARESDTFSVATHLQPLRIAAQRRRHYGSLNLQHAWQCNIMPAGQSSQAAAREVHYKDVPIGLHDKSSHTVAPRNHWQPSTGQANQPLPIAMAPHCNTVVSMPAIEAASVSLANRLGLPRLKGHASLALAIMINSLGDGIFTPFSIVYFSRTTRLPLPVIGFSLTLAGLFAIPAAGIAGILADRFRPSSVMIAGSLLAALAFGGYLLVAHVWQLIGLALLAAVGRRSFWTADLALIAQVFNSTQHRRWFAFQQSIWNAGLGLGGVAGAAIIETRIRSAYYLLVAVDAFTYVLAASLLLIWHRAYSPRAAEVLPCHGAGRPTSAARGVRSFRAALCDLPLLILSSINFLCVTCMISIDVLLVVFLTQGLHQSAWLCGILFGANTLLIAACQTMVSQSLRALRPTRSLQHSMVVWAASFVLIWVMVPLPHSTVVPIAVMAIAIFTAAELIMGPILNHMVIDMAPESIRGRYIAIFQLSYALAQSLAPGLLTWLYSFGPGWPWLVLAIACGSCALGLGRYQTSLT